MLPHEYSRSQIQHYSFGAQTYTQIFSDFSLVVKFEMGQDRAPNLERSFMNVLVSNGLFLYHFVSLSTMEYVRMH